MKGAAAAAADQKIGAAAAAAAAAAEHDDTDDADEVWPSSNEELWRDVTPLSTVLDEGPHPVVEIDTSPQFRRAHALLYALLSAGERSQRALDLTREVIHLNNANYTAWHYRRQILEGMEGEWDLADELAFSEEWIFDSPKSYQVWQHRRWLVEKAADPSKELEVCASVLNNDAKNYNAWSHRQWVVRTYGLWAAELAFAEAMLQEDFRNNSAWNHRWVGSEGKAGRWMDGWVCGGTTW
mmetsp:Transcript_4952/g.13425  ORF Transcript_4952/g.13425 Transcript_4952/m.13425 type:complete len:239 (-) Transcript_4952:580-1296(-)